MSDETLKALLLRAPAEIRAAMVSRVYPAGASILHHGEESRSIYLLREGSVSVSGHSAGGRTLSLYTYGPWELFGEVEIFDERQRAKEITVLRRAEALVFPREVFLSWMRADFAFSLYVCRQLVHKLSYSGNRAAQLLTLPQRSRLLLCLYAAEREGRIAAVRKEQLCGDLCIPLRSLNRIVRQCREEGLIGYRARAFTVTDPSRLAREVAPLLEGE